MHAANSRNYTGGTVFNIDTILYDQPQRHRGFEEWNDAMTQV
mgnify:CR=1 FL=1